MRRLPIDHIVLPLDFDVLVSKGAKRYLRRIESSRERRVAASIAIHTLASAARHHAEPGIDRRLYPVPGARTLYILKTDQLRGWGIFAEHSSQSHTASTRIPPSS